jgi:hypothetical protein
MATTSPVNFSHEPQRVGFRRFNVSRLVAWFGSLDALITCYFNVHWLASSKRRLVTASPSDVGYFRGIDCLRPSAGTALSFFKGVFSCPDRAINLFSSRSTFWLRRCCSCLQQQDQPEQLHQATVRVDLTAIQLFLDPR